jgi:hypothetical protein
MNAILKPTPRELAEERERLFEECRKDFVFMLEVLGENREWLKYYTSREAQPLVQEMDKLLWSYLDRTGLFERAESEAAGRKELGV